MRDVVIVGAGLAGLTCARALQVAGADCVVLEAEDAPGGRVRTDEVKGFRLDRGFQVLLTAYPTARRWLDFGALKLGEFEPGAWVATPEGTGCLADPWRRPGEIWRTLRAPVGTLADKWRVARMRWDVARVDAEALWSAVEGRSAAEELERRGFSVAMMERFFRPWLGGIFLESALETPTAMLWFVYRMFSEGAAALPAGGMGRIPEQLVAGLRPGTLRLGARVKEVRRDGVVLEDGEEVRAGAVVVATEVDVAARLVDGAVSAMPKWRGTVCLQWAARRSPFEGEPVLWLNGMGRGRVNHVAVPSDIAHGYAPEGCSLISTTLCSTRPNQGEEPSNAGLEAVVREELCGYFGAEVKEWRLLAVQRVPRALPVLARPGAGKVPRRTESGVWVCGDHCASASIEGAMASGEAVARALAKDASG